MLGPPTTRRGVELVKPTGTQQRGLDVKLFKVQPGGRDATSDHSCAVSPELTGGSTIPGPLERTAVVHRQGARLVGQAHTHLGGGGSWGDPKVSPGRPGTRSRTRWLGSLLRR